MKPVSKLVISLMLVLLCTTGILGAPPPARAHARRILRRTALVLLTAQKKAGEGGKYLGMGRAVMHQEYARRLYRKGVYLDAIYHSLRARRLAADVIRRNNGAESGDLYDKSERDYLGKTPKDEDLDAALAGRVDPVADAAAVKIRIVTVY